MSVVTRATAKTYFENGDTPTESQFVDLMDSIPFSPVMQRVVTFDGQGGIVTVGSKMFFRAKAGTITGWSILAEGTSPTCTIDVWKVATGTSLPTVANTIMGTKPALSTGNAVYSNTLAGWTTTVSDNDIFYVNVDAVANATKIQFILEIT